MEMVKAGIAVGGVEVGIVMKEGGSGGDEGRSCGRDDAGRVVMGIAVRGRWRG